MEMSSSREKDRFEVRDIVKCRVRRLEVEYQRSGLGNSWFAALRSRLTCIQLLWRASTMMRFSAKCAFFDLLVLQFSQFRMRGLDARPLYRVTCFDYFIASNARPLVPRSQSPYGSSQSTPVSS
jgi:hypothetical protein